MKFLKKIIFFFAISIAIFPTSSFADSEVVLEMQEVEDNTFTAEVTVENESAPWFIVGKNSNLLCAGGNDLRLSNNKDISQYDNEYTFEDVFSNVQGSLGYGEFYVRFCLLEKTASGQELHYSDVKKFTVSGGGGNVSYAKIINSGGDDYFIKGSVLNGKNIQTWFDIVKEENKDDLTCDIKKTDNIYRFEISGRYNKGDNFKSDDFMGYLRSIQTSLENAGGDWYNGKYYAVACGKDDEGNILDHVDYFAKFYVTKQVNENTGDNEDSFEKAKADIYNAENITNKSVQLKGKVKNAQEKWFSISTEKSALDCSDEELKMSITGVDGNYVYTNISGLNSSTKYYFKVCYTDLNGDTGGTSYNSFTTKSQNDNSIENNSETNISSIGGGNSNSDIESAKSTLTLLTEFVYKRISETGGNFTDQDWTIINFMLKDVYNYLGLKM